MNLKQKLCNDLIENNMVKEFDVIRHSYSNSRINDWDNRGVECNNEAPCITTRADTLGVVVNDEPKVINPLKDKTQYGWHFEQQVYDEEGITRTVKAGGGSGNIPKVIENDVKPKCIGGIGEKKSNGGRQWYQQDRIYEDNCAISVTTAYNPYYQSNLRIRKLTPLECWRLMSFDDDDFNKAAQVNSNAQLYKQAGNSICVNVLEHIFAQML